jgi:hypothetical protein
MTRIVRTAYRYKRPPGKRKPVALEVPAIVRKNGRRRDAAAEEKEEKSLRLSGPGQEDPTPASDDRKPAVLTIRRQPERILPPGLLAETEEEANRRADAADAMFRELVRRVREDR